MPMWSKASVTIHNYWYSLLAEKPTEPSRRPNKPVMIDSYSTGLLRGFTRQIFTVMLYDRTWLFHQPQCYLRWTGPPSYSKKAHSQHSGSCLFTNQIGASPALLSGGSSVAAAVH